MLSLLAPLLIFILFIVFSVVSLSVVRDQKEHKDRWAIGAIVLLLAILAFVIAIFQWHGGWLFVAFLLAAAPAVTNFLKTHGISRSCHIEGRR